MPTYATDEQLTQRYDERTIKDLLSDDGTTLTTLTGNAKLTALLAEASGRINSAVRMGAQYTQTQLAALITQDDEDTALLVGLCCDITMALLLRRRPEKFKTAMGMLTEIDKNFLEPLRTGTHVFDIDVRGDAAAIAQGDEVNTADVIRTRPITHRAIGYYPSRPGNLPMSRGQ